MYTKNTMKPESQEMNKESAAMHHRIRGLTIAFAALIILLLCGFAAGGAAAGEITVTAPSSPAAAGETITLPVIMTGAEDIAGVTFEIANNVPGVTITVSKSNSLPVGSYLINSNPENSVQKAVWFSASGITGDSVELFSLDVVISSSAAASVPIVITPVTIVNSNSGFLTDQYPVASAEIQLTDTAVGNVAVGTVESQSSQTAEKKDSAAKPTTAASEPQKTEILTPTEETPVPTQSTPQSTSLIPESPQAQPVKTTSAASPLGLLPFIGLAAAAFFIGRKERIL